MANVFNPSLSRRKRFLPEYRQLFEALLNIPDLDVQNRVAQAVNNMQKCSVCKNKISSMKDAATQTSDALELTIEADQLQFRENKESGADKGDQIPAKRRRNRKRAYPKVVKRAQHSNNNPILRQENTSAKKMDADNCPVVEIRSDDEAVNSFLAHDFMNFDKEPSIEYIQNQMKLELLSFYKYDNGYLPIHDAIATNEINKLKRQLYVMKFRKEELLSLCTDFGEDPIQLAIKKNCVFEIINELLTEVTDLNDCDDDDCNTVIHLAVIYLKPYEKNEQTSILKIFESLLEKVDMKLLLKRNNDGLTALQIAVNENKFLMVEKMFDVLDKKLKLKPLTGTCTTDMQSFKNHYDAACNDLEDRQTDELKSKILNATSMKCGRTALYFAIERQYDHLIYLLMAHRSNPTIKNFSGQDAKTYYNEYGKNPTIAGFLDKLTAMFS